MIETCLKIVKQLTAILKGNMDLDFQRLISWSSFLCSVGEGGVCSFCWYWWNCWPSMYKLLIIIWGILFHQKMHTKKRNFYFQYLPTGSNMNIKITTDASTAEFSETKIIKIILKLLVSFYTRFWQVGKWWFPTLV